MKPAIFNSLYWMFFILLIMSWLFDFNTGIIAVRIVLTVLLTAYFLSATRFTPVILRVLIPAAMAYFILQVHVKSTLSSTLLYLIYIAFFLKIRYTNYPLPTCKWAFIFLSEAVALAIFFYYLPTLDNVWPVIAFMLSASIALQSVMHAFRLKEQPAGWYCLAGILLLIIGDMLKMGAVSAHVLCYGLANYGLVYGATRQLGTN